MSGFSSEAKFQIERPSLISAFASCCVSHTGSTVFTKTPVVGISDSAFHSSVPDFVKYYAIPKKVSKDLDIYHLYQ